MNKYTYFLFLSLLAAAGCHEAEPIQVQEDVPGNYITVGMNITHDGIDSKSVVSPEVEDFHSAVLYALNPKTGRILLYGSNAGELSGTPVWISTQSKYFSWPLPEKTAMTVYCIVNPPEGFEEETPAANVSKSVLDNKYFCCEGHTGLKSLETSGNGLPLTGIKEVGADEITSDDAYLSLSVSHVFAKFSISLDLTGLDAGEKLTVNKLAVNNGNTRAPLFGSDYKQTDASFLTDSDYASTLQLAQLSKGGDGNNVEIYVLENCHGTHTGASSWWTVYKDLHQNWPEISQCTFVQLSYSITSNNGDINSYLSRIYLGSGNMVEDFNVKRNLYKSICIKISRRTGETDPGFQFGKEIYRIGPGAVQTVSYESNIYSTTSHETAPEIWITDSSGQVTSDLTIISNNPASGEAEIRAGTNCATGTYYWINGGFQSAFFWPPYGSNASPLKQRRKITIVESLSLSFDPPSCDLYPYQKAEYLSRERYSQSVAQQLAQSVVLSEITGSIDHQLTSIGIKEIDGDYAVLLTLVPDRPGTIGFTARYGDEGNEAEGGTIYVQEPVLAAFSNSAQQDNYHVDALGNPTSITWRLMSRDSIPLENPEAGGEFSISKNDSFGSGLLPTVTSVGSGSYSRTMVNTVVRVTSFDGLPGFDDDNYTFNGITVQTKGTFTYRSGYAVSKTVSVTIDDPLSDYSYDGRICEYSIRQGWTNQSEYVTASNPEYKLEYLLRWPMRVFSVDLTRGGTRQCLGLEKWTEHSSISSLADFTLTNGRITGIPEDMRRWGPVYYGRRLTNIVSGEKKTFIHSILRLYCHYNVFAAIDAQEKNKVKVNWDDLGNVNWNPTLMLTHYHFGTFTACLRANFDLGDYFTELVSLIQKTITTDTRAKPILSGFKLDASGKPSAHGTYSAGYHSNYQCYVSGDWSYMIGYWKRPSDLDKYNIDYDWVYQYGTDDNADRISWRVIAANNTPWFKAGPGGNTVNGNYITPIQKNSDGEYCFSIIPSGSSTRDYVDSEGYGYQRISFFWEGREGKKIINSKDLHPLTSYNANLCIVNGWYDPTSYTNGLPIPANKVGMYFFPESESANTRSGYPPYYTDDWPYSVGDRHGSMEIGVFSHLEFGDLSARDRNAAR